ncbi:MAG: prepilin-type N-terminal cleavage/methylation domain-containing protein [Verrucomicrobia bacterium]|nr:prepilin-type N-terminal cleavage/methylation domain-containing protein [Verrucomicrobiota bacterium]
MPTQVLSRRGGPGDATAGPKAFSLAELLIVLAVVATLAVLQVPTLGNAKSGSRLAICQDNLRQLTRGWLLYAQDNNGRLTGNLDGGDVMAGMANAARTWCVGWLDFNGGSPSGANTNTQFLSEAQLGPYIQKEVRIFRCPADPSVSLFGGVAYPRVRSVSMNCYMGERGQPYTAGYKQFKTLDEITGPSPAKALVFIDEREDSINDGWFGINMIGFDPPGPDARIMVDFPADWHGRRGSLSFADGHVESWHWRDPRTMPRHRKGILLPLAVATPNNTDVARIQAAASSKAK